MSEEIKLFLFLFNFLWKLAADIALLDWLHAKIIQEIEKPPC